MSEYDEHCGGKSDDAMNARVSNPYYEPLPLTKKDKLRGLFLTKEPEVYFLSAFIAACVSGVGAFSFFATAFFDSTSFAAELTGACIASVIFVIASTFLAINETHDRHKAHLLATVEVAEPCSSALATLSADIQSLAEDSREDVRTLWDTCLLANEILLSKPDDEEALAAIMERSEVIADLLREQGERAKVEAREALVNKTRDLHEQLSIRGRDDLIFAQQKLEASRHGTETFKNLSPTLEA